MGSAGRLVTRKFAYGLGGGNSGPRGRPRPAIRSEAICGAESGQAPDFGIFCATCTKRQFEICLFWRLILWKFRHNRPLSAGRIDACQVIKMHKNNAKSSAFCTKTWRFLYFLYKILGAKPPYFADLCFVKTKLYEFLPKLKVISRFALAISQFSVNSDTISCNFLTNSSFSSSFLAVFLEVSNL